MFFPKIERWLIIITLFIAKESMLVHSQPKYLRLIIRQIKKQREKERMVNQILIPDKKQEMK